MDQSTIACDVPAAPSPRLLRAGWKRVVLVCKACQKRRGAPQRLTAAKLARALRRAGRQTSAVRTRVVLTSCMGACPKKAITVAGATDGEAIRMVAFRRHDDAGAAVEALFDAEPEMDLPLAAPGGPGRAYSKSTSDAPSST